MTIQAIRLVRFELTVADLLRSERFYVDALGFAPLQRETLDPPSTTLLGAGKVRQAALRRGGQTLMLMAFDEPGAPYPADATACDQVFQHFALPVTDMAAAYARMQPFLAPTISTAGPQHLPQRSGGATAYKFRDPDGHPLELIQFADGHIGGIDHSAIAVADADRSIAFYRDRLGLRIAARQTNKGVEQDRLDGLTSVAVEVVALEPETATPHLELLAYQEPTGRPGRLLRPNDIAATRLVLEVSELPVDAASRPDGSRAMLCHDPDHHALMLVTSAA